MCGSQSTMNTFLYWLLLHGMVINFLANIQIVNASCHLNVTAMEDKMYQCIRLNLTWNISEDDQLGEPTAHLIPDEECLDPNGEEYIIHEMSLGFNSQILNCARKLKLIPTCQYAIRFPLGTSGEACETHFTLPMCVGDICHCENRSDLLSNISIDAVDNEHIVVKWTNKKEHYLKRIEIEHYTNNTESEKDGKYNISANITFTNELDARAVNGEAQTFFAYMPPPGQTDFCFNFYLEDDCRYVTCNYTDARGLPPGHMIQIIIVVTVFIIAIVIIVIYFIHSTRQKYDLPSNQAQGPTNFLRNVLYTTTPSVQDAMEIHPSRLTMLKEIGAGAFGVVYKGTLNDDGLRTKLVAVKQLQSVFTEERDAFIEEMQTMKTIGYHPHIVKLIGYCTETPPLAIIMELIPCGSLKTYLVELREKWYEGSVFNMYVDNTTGSSANTPMNGRHISVSTQYTNLTSTSTGEGVSNLAYVLDSKELQSFALQIAKGMAHLESIRVTHRDLAARNVLINEEKMLKISDFGMSRPGVYVNMNTKRIPMRWMAIEALENNCTDNRSDVWSFGVVLWEIGTLGAFPYEGVLDALVLPQLKGGLRLQRPEICTDDLYALMLRCWDVDADARPTFAAIVKELENDMKQAYVDFDNIDRSYIFPPMKN